MVNPSQYGEGGAPDMVEQEVEPNETAAPEAPYQPGPGIMEPVPDVTEARVREIVREMIGEWKHDADHGASQAQRDAQAARDAAAGVAAE